MKRSVGYGIIAALGAFILITIFSLISLTDPEANCWWTDWCTGNKLVYILIVVSGMLCAGIGTFLGTLPDKK